MIELNDMEITQVSGGFKLFNIGAAIAAIAVGVVTGGPVGLGIALCSITMAQGVNNLDELYHGDVGQ